MSFSRHITQAFGFTPELYLPTALQTILYLEWQGELHPGNRSKYWNLLRGTYSGAAAAGAAMAADGGGADEELSKGFNDQDESARARRAWSVTNKAIEDAEECEVEDGSEEEEDDEVDAALAALDVEWEAHVAQEYGGDAAAALAAAEALAANEEDQEDGSEEEEDDNEWNEMFARLEAVRYDKKGRDDIPKDEEGLPFFNMAAPFEHSQPWVFSEPNDDVVLDESKKVTIGETNYFKSPAYGLPMVLFSYPTGIVEGAYDEATGEIKEIVFGESEGSVSSPE